MNIKENNIVCDCKIIANEKIAKDTYKITLKWENMPKIKAGQFVNLSVEGCFLRRPISISEVLDEDKIVIVYKVIGEGTKKLSKLLAKEDISLMGPLGNGYTLAEEKKVLLIGGGVGVPPLLQLAKEYREKKVEVTVVLGFLDRESVFYENEFKDLGCATYVSTDDKSYGYGGNVIECIENFSIDIDFVCACGPTGMLKAVEKKYKNGFLSFESRMACGVGVCMACVARDKKEENMYHRICKEGPVFKIGTIEF